MSSGDEIGGLVNAAERAAVAPAVARICGRCGESVPSERTFCSRCGSCLETNEAAAASQIGPLRVFAGFEVTAREVIEGLGGLSRAAVKVAGRGDSELEHLEAPPGSNLDRLASEDEIHRMGVFPRVLARSRDREGLDLLVDKSEPQWLTLRGWWAERAGSQERYSRVLALLANVLKTLGILHGAGWIHAGLQPDRILIHPEDESVRVDWPLVPLVAGEPAAAAVGDARYMAPDFGYRGALANPSWDLFALGASLFWTLSGMDAAHWMSRVGTPLPQVRLFVPDLPAGWGGMFDVLLSRDPTARPASAEALLRLVHGIGISPRPPSGHAVCAAGLDPGVTKIRSSPLNQDRCILVGGSDFGGRPLVRTRAEAFLTGDLDVSFPLVAGVTDGVSCAVAGELAAGEIARRASEICWAVRDSGGAASSFLMNLSDQLNACLVSEVARLSGSGALPASALSPGPPPAATLAVLRLTSAGAAAVGVGDSRIYLLRHGLLDTLTTDGDEFSRLVRLGVDPAEARMNERARDLVGWIGRFEVKEGGDGQSASLCPLSVSEGPGISSLAFRPAAGDVYCCCSDGLSDYVDAGLIDLAGVLCDPSPAAACRRLISEANGHGGLDNISVVVVRLPDVDPSEEREANPCPA